MNDLIGWYYLSHDYHMIITCSFSSHVLSLFQGSDDIQRENFETALEYIKNSLKRISVTVGVSE